MPPVPSPFETEEVYLCAATDPRLRLLERGEPTKTARLILRRFSSTLGDRYKPGCLLVRADARPDVRTGEAIRAFRNACSIATVSRAWAASIAHASAGQWTAKWSDFFLMGYHTPGEDGSLVNLHGIVRGMDDADRLAHFRAQSSPQIGDPTDFSVYVDEGLLRRLLVAWRRVYVQSLQRRTFRRLFRALEVAFHAAQYPGDGLPSLTDAGNRLALWVSAFEILFHPGGTRRITKRIVQQALSRVPWSKKALTIRRYVIGYEGKQLRVTLPEKFYDDLYYARNRFLHGEPVTGVELRYRQSRRYLQLHAIAPVLFNAALLSFLCNLIPGGPGAQTSHPEDFLDWYDGLRAIQQALFAARHPVDRYGHPLVPPPAHPKADSVPVTPSTRGPDPTVG